MRLLFTLCICLLALPGHAQERVRNVKLRVADSSQLEISYDLVNARPGDSIYLEVRSRLRGSLRLLPEFVRGDVGQRVMAGSGRRIVWNALANGYSLNEEIRATVLVKTGLPIVRQSADEPAVSVQPETSRTKSNAVRKPERPEAVAVTPDPAVSGVDTVVARKKRYAGPAWALLSAVVPGFGNIFVQTPKPRIGLRPLLAASCYGLLAYGLGERLKSRDAYALYEEKKNAQTADPYYQTANDQYHRYYLATRGAIVIAAADVILTLFKGLRNVRAAAPNRPLSSVTLRPGIQFGQPTAVVRYSF